MTNQQSTIDLIVEGKMSNEESLELRYIYQKDFQSQKNVEKLTYHEGKSSLNANLSKLKTLADLRDLYSTIMEEDFYFIDPSTCTRIDEGKEEYYQLEEVIKDNVINVVIPDLIEITEAFTQGPLKVAVKLMPTPNPNNADFKEHPPVMVRNVGTYKNVLLCQDNTNLAFEITSKGKYGFGTSISIGTGKGDKSHVIIKELYYLNSSSPDRLGTIEISCYQNQKNSNISAEPVRNLNGSFVREPLLVDDFIQKRCSKYPCRVVTWSLKQPTKDSPNISKTVTDVFQPANKFHSNLPHPKKPPIFSRGFGEGISEGDKSPIRFKEVEIAEIDINPDHLQMLDFFIVVGTYDEIKEITSQIQKTAKTPYVFPTTKLVHNLEKYSGNISDDDIVPSALIFNNNLIAAWKASPGDSSRIQYALYNIGAQESTPLLTGSLSDEFDAVTPAAPSVVYFGTYPYIVSSFATNPLNSLGLISRQLRDNQWSRKGLHTGMAELDKHSAPAVALGSSGKVYGVLKGIVKDNNLFYFATGATNTLSWLDFSENQSFGRLNGLSSELNPCLALLDSQPCVVYTTPDSHQLKYAFFTPPGSGDLNVTPIDVEAVSGSARCLQIFNFNKQLYMVWRKYDDPFWKMSFVKFERTSNDGASTITGCWVPAPEIQIPSFTRYRRGFIVPSNDTLYIV